MGELKPCEDCRYHKDCSANMTDAVWDRAYERRHGRDCWKGECGTDPMSIKWTPAKIDVRILERGLDVPTSVLQSRIKLENTPHDFARVVDLEMGYRLRGAPDAFAALEEIRSLVDAMERKLYPELYAEYRHREQQNRVLLEMEV